VTGAAEVTPEVFQYALQQQTRKFSIYAAAVNREAFKNALQQ
jgi:hypothetical protein